MSTTSRIILDNPQTRVKDCYASAPKIDLTVRANGEEKVQVMDSLGNLYSAGLDAPTSSPSVSLGSGSFFTASRFWAYQYVYVAKTYHLVENAVTGGGSPAPRSNPSPTSTIQTSATNLQSRVISCPTTTRGDITHIWIYRTDQFTTSQEATDNATAGNLTFIAEIINAPDVPSISYTDTNTVAFGANEQIENDNFVAPIFDKIVYADPYFWGFGNGIFSTPVTVATSGLVTITSGKWFSGRDGQTCTFTGITTGGFDTHGTFYFKTLSNTTAQVYSDLALTVPANIPAAGTTTITIQGQASVLYRSKPRNPFSWGFTEQIGDSLIPQPYFFSLGAGSGTAIAVVPNQNLLKLDTEGPNATYTLNLKNAGTPNFETSLRLIANNYSMSNQHAQFSATLEQGQNVLWGIDFKSFAIIQSDGYQQQPVSSMVYKLLRQLATGDSDRAMFHGAYCPRTELNCMFCRLEGAFNDNLNLLVYYHAPTGYWGTMDVFDILSSSQVLDRNSGQYKLLVGSSDGFIGEAFPDSTNQGWQNWFRIAVNSSFQVVTGAFIPDPNLNSNQVTTPGGLDFTDFTTNNIMPGVIGNWITIVQKTPDGGGGIPTKVYYCHISGVSDDTNSTLLFDRVIHNGIGATYPFTPDPTDGSSETYCYLGLIEVEVGRTFNAAFQDIRPNGRFTRLSPFDNKKVQEVFMTWDGFITAADSFLQNPKLVCIPKYIDGSPGEGILDEQAFVYSNGPATSAKTPITGPVILSLQTQLNLDIGQYFSVLFRDRSFNPIQLVNYEIRIDSTDGNNS